MPVKQKQLPQQPLTIFLLKEGVTEPDEFLKAPGALERHDVQGGPFQGLYVRSSVPHDVSWAKLFRGAVDGLDVRSQSAAAVLHVRTQGRDFALVFGYGRSLLEPGSYESDFGFRVTLNTVDPGEIHSVERSSFDAISSRSTIQAGEAARIGDFGINPDRDLLRAVVGKPEDESLACKVAGADALKVWARTGLKGIPELLGRYLAQYRRNVPERFRWLMNLRPISDVAEIGALNQKLLTTLPRQGQQAVWLLVPEIVDAFELDGFTFSTDRRATPDPYLRVATLLAALPQGKPLTVELLKNSKVQAHKTGRAEPEDKWPVFDCLHAQFEDRQGLVVLSEGKWYRVAASLRKEVEAHYEGVEKIEALLPPFLAADHSEENYNKRAAKSLGWALHDRKLYKGEIEFCDLYDSAGRRIVHVKRHGRSSVLSHLFAQGLNSAQLLARDSGFRNFCGVGNASGHTVLFAITSDSAGPLDIPFFSKLTLKNAATELRAMGYGVALTKIEDRSSLKRRGAAA